MGETMYQENGKRKKSGFVSEKKDEDQKHYQNLKTTAKQQLFLYIKDTTSTLVWRNNIAPKFTKKNI